MVNVVANAFAEALEATSSGSVQSWILRIDARAIPKTLACSNLPGMTRPPDRQSTKSLARTRDGRIPAISGYQVVCAANWAA